MVDMFVKVLCLLVFTSESVLSDDESVNESSNASIVIGGIFYEDEVNTLEAALSIAAEEYNLTATVKTVKRGKILDIGQAICDLAKEDNVIGVIDGLGGKGTEHVQAICDMLELPHVIIQPNDLYTGNWSILNMYPSATAYNNVLRELINLKDWNNFTLLYEKGHSIKLMSTLMEMGNNTDPFTISIRELSGDDYRNVLINAKEQGYTNFVVDCTSEKLNQLLLHAQQVDLMADEHSYIFLSPDLFSLDLARFRYGGVNMTGFHIKGLNKNLQTFTKAFNEKSGNDPNDENPKTNVILIYDAVRVFVEAIKKIINDETLVTESAFVPKDLDCSTYNTWEYGTTLMNFMKTNKIEGLSRTLSFDGLGQRNDVKLDILELTPSGSQMIGVWENNNITLTRLFHPPTMEHASIMKNKTFVVLISMTPPFTYLKDSAVQLVGNDRYEGFAVDLIEELSKLLMFDYELEKENNYTIMAKKLVNEEAEFAICDFTITMERQEIVDFSIPFMSLGIGILFKEPSKQPPAMFSFMAVFSKDVWLWMLFIQICIGVLMIFVGRISNKEWQNPVPCIEQPEELSNQFSFANSIWLIIGSVMQQGSEIAPIALAPRMITSIWWFFTMVIMASYVGILVAFLTVTKNVLPFNNLEELLQQSKSISYGYKSGGSTETFFKNSLNPTHKELNKHMIRIGSNDEGVAKAENSTFAFFSESSAILYYTSRHCDLLQVGDLLDSKSYGIGMTKNSTYKKYIDDALLHIKESGELQKMQDKWWKEMRGGGKCEEKKEEDAKQLSMQNMKGAFVVLGAGCGFGLIISVMDMLWWVFKRSVKYNTTFKYELIEELKFAIKFQGDVKPVKRPNKSAEGSEEALAVVDGKDESKDELGSLRSARTIMSGRSTSTRRSVHSHCSRHTPSELSVAFARRRQYS